MATKYQRTERWFAMCGIVGGGLAILNTPLVVLASIRAHQTNQGDVPAALPGILAPLLEFAEPSDVYVAYGRLWAPILLLYLLGAAALYTRVEPRLIQQGRPSFSVLITGLLLVILGVLADYWLGPDVLGRRAWGLAFLVLTVFGLVIYTAGSTWLGAQFLRHRATPPWTAIPFTAAALGFLLIPVVPNMPAAQLLVFALAWIASGVFVLRVPRGDSPSA